MSAPSATQVGELASRWPSRRDRARVLVSDRLYSAARTAATDAGLSWLDRRGHLRLRAPGVIIDSAVPPMQRPREPDLRNPIRGRSGISVALALLMHPDDPPGVREMARRSGLSPTAVSVAARKLQDASLLDDAGHPLTPELFWVLEDEWERAVGRHTARAAPSVSDEEFLQLGLTDLEAPGWAVAGATAAIAWDAPLLQAGPASPDYFVPSPAILSRARHRLAEPEQADGAAVRIGVAPSRLVVARRYMRHVPDVGDWPTVHPVVAALDLALDHARGREALDDWTPPEGFTRVW